MKALRSLVATLSILALTLTLIGCGGTVNTQDDNSKASENSASSNENSGTTSDDSTTDESNEMADEKVDTGSDSTNGTQAGLPATISAHGNSYTINSLELTEDESGNTVVSCSTNGFNVLPMKNNKMIIPVYCAAIVDGTEIEFASFSTQADTTDFIFDSKIDPDTIVFYPEDARDTRTEVSLA